MSSRYKVCTKCGEEKILDEYYKKGKRKDGSCIYRSECKMCCLERKKTYYEKNKETISHKGKKYYVKNKESIGKRNKIYYEKNKESIAETARVYYNKNRELICNKKSEYYVNNKEATLDRMKGYYIKNKESIAERRMIYYEENKEQFAEWNKEHYDIKRKEEYKVLIDEFKQYVKENPEYQDYEADVWTYIIKSDGFWKIGITNQLDGRICKISKHIPICKLYRLPINIERRLHLELDEHRFSFGEKFDGYTELFDISDEHACEIIKRERFKKCEEVFYDYKRD